MAKCLVCILAQVRAHRLTWSSFKTNVLDQLKADLALCVSKKQNESGLRDNEFYKNAKYTWEYEEPRDYGDAYDYVKKKLGSAEDWRILLKIKDQWLGGILGEEPQGGSAGILIFYRWLLNQKLVEEGLVEKYDRFIITRADYLYCAPHPPLDLLAPEYIWMPEGEQYQRYTDRHVVANSKEIIKCINLMDDIILTPKKLYRSMMFFDKWNLETFIARHFKKNKLDQKVKIFPPVMFTVREKSGKTRWKKGIYNSELGCYVKYKGEFDKSYKKYCRIIKDNKDWGKILEKYNTTPQKTLMDFFFFKVIFHFIKETIKKLPLKVYAKERK